MNALDDDLASMSRDELVAVVKTLRAGIRRHRDCSGHDLCWYHPALWSLLPEQASAEPRVPAWDRFMEGCVQFRKSLDEQLPNASRTDERFDQG